MGNEEIYRIEENNLEGLYHFRIIVTVNSRVVNEFTIQRAASAELMLTAGSPSESQWNRATALINKKPI